MGVISGACYEVEPNFNSLTSVYQVLAQIEQENTKLEKMQVIKDKEDEPKTLIQKCINKTNSILKFVKNKPLNYMDERLSKFTQILTKFYSCTIRNEPEKFSEVEEELQDFIFNMMDYYNGIRISVAPNISKSASL